MYEENRGISVRVFGGSNTNHTYDELLEDIRQQVTPGDIEELVNATSHIEEKPNNTQSEKEEKHEKEESAEYKEKNISSKNESIGKEIREDIPEERKDRAKDQENDEPVSTDATVERVEGEVVETVESAEMQQATTIDPNTLRGYKSAMSSNTAQMIRCLEEENWPRMKKLAEDIIWRVNMIIGEGEKA